MAMFSSLVVRNGGDSRHPSMLGSAGRMSL